MKPSVPVHDFLQFLHEIDQQRLTAALEGLHGVRREAFLETLAQIDPQTVRGWLAEGKLQEWVTQGLRLFSEKRDLAEHLAATFFAATPVILPVLTQSEISEWVRVWMDIAETDQPETSVMLPDGFVDLDRTERLGVYRLVRTAAARSPHAAATLYRSLPQSFGVLPVSLRGPLFGCLQAAATFDPKPLPAVLPFLSPTLRSLPPESQGALLERIALLARTFPAGVARLFRVLARAYDEVGIEGVKTWLAAGEELARRNPQAGEAFFALESRTSLLTLRGASPAVVLGDVQGLLLKFLHMLCGVAVGITEADFLTFPPPLAEEAGESLPLPASIEVFPTYEENFRLYRVLAAHQAGRAEFGTYNPPLSLLWPHLRDSAQDLIALEAEPVDDLTSYFRLFPHPEQIEALFVFIESKRIATHLALRYRGLQEDLAWADTLTHLLPPGLSPFLPALSSTLWPDLGKEATVYDSLLLATKLYASRVSPARRSSFPSPSDLQPENAETMENTESEMFVEVEDDSQGSTALSAEQQAALQKIMAALRSHPRKKKKAQGKKGATVVLNMSASNQTDAEDLAETSEKKKKATGHRQRTATGVRYLYDEWDYLIEDYRTQWCQVREMPLSGDAGAFFSRTLAAYADLTPEIKREFQRLRPRMYRQVTGLEHGEDIDLNAAIAAQVDRRSGMTPSSKLYAARQPLERDVSALFLLDMSASTDMRLPEKENVRIIDILKEALVLLSAALEDIGDVYAIYGFSSHGRRNVEVYPVKTFAESLSPEVKERIGGIHPQRSTRMGAAVRHVTRKMKDLSCRAKLLVLLSDGYPEDADYGRDKHAPTYGLRDTMMALREAEKSGVLSFCLTVDKGGHDYLREMCPPSRYMVIEDVLSLPLELPKIYQRHIRSQRL